MKKIIAILLAVHCSLLTVHRGSAQIIHVPADQPTIQHGINAATDGDTVLVDPGTYVENINFNGKRITVASLFLINHNEDYITQTIIDGNAAGSVVKFISNEDSTALLSGFTLQNGSAAAGGGIFISWSFPKIENCVICNNSATGTQDERGAGGGGIYAYRSMILSLKNLLITRNNSRTIGGGISSFGYSAIVMENVTITYNFAGDYGGGICAYSSGLNFSETKRCNIYLNDAEYATDIYNEGPEKAVSQHFYEQDLPGNKIDNTLLVFNTERYTIIVDTFTVLHPTSFHADGNYVNSFDILNGKLEQPDADLYISPSGNNENDGLSPESPLKTIHHALRIVRADSSHRNALKLLDGTYSHASTGEVFPVRLPAFVDMDGTDPFNVLLDAENMEQVVFITGTNDLSNMTVTNGIEGGIHCQGGYGDRLLLDHLIISNNSSSFIGGGIVCTGYGWNEITIKNSMIINNTAIRGGGIYTSNSISIHFENVSINENIAKEGGGIFCDSYAVVDLEKATISGNMANSGGGIYFQGDTLTLNKCEITNNQAIGDILHPGYGGGLYCWATQASIENSLISGNDAHGAEGSGGYGGGIFCSYTDLVLAGSTISNNMAESFGGGIYPQYTSTFAFNDTNRCNIYLNHARYGNDISSQELMEIIVDTFTVVNPTEYHAGPFYNFTFDILNGKLPQYEADVYVSPDGDDANSGLTAEEPFKTIQYASTRILRDSLNFHTINLSEGEYSPSATGEIFPVNMLPYMKLSGISKEDVILDADGQGNAIEFKNNDHSTLSNLTLTGSNSNAIFLDMSDAVIHDIIVKGNTGNGIYCENSSPIILDALITLNGSEGIVLEQSSPEIENVIISYNDRGGLVCKGESNPVLTTVLLEGNTAEYGAGLYCQTSSCPRISHSIIRNNTATLWGGGICNLFGGPVLEDVIIEDNIALDGGGVYSMILNTEPVFSGVNIQNNTALDRGGGLFLYHHSSPMYNILIASNSASEGGAIYCTHLSEPQLINFTISGNQAGVGGGIICSRKAAPVLLNTVIWQNSAPEIYFNSVEEPVNITISNSNIEGGESSIFTNDNGTVNWLEGNIDANPMFAGQGDFPYSLSVGSPCIDAGIHDTTGLFLPLTDLAGNPRVWGDRVDMGAYEWNNMGFPESNIQHLKFNIDVFPNPTSGMVDFRWTMDDGRWVTLKIYDVHGREVATVLDTKLPAGEHRFSFDVSCLPDGMYFLQVAAGDEVASGKLVVLH